MVRVEYWTGELQYIHKIVDMRLTEYSIRLEGSRKLDKRPEKYSFSKISERDSRIPGFNFCL